jgi:hypothetical protein
VAPVPGQAHSLVVARQRRRCLLDPSLVDQPSSQDSSRTEKSGYLSVASEARPSPCFRPTLSYHHHSAPITRYSVSCLASCLSARSLRSCVFVYVISHTHTHNTYPLISLLWYVPSSRYIWSSAPFFFSARTNKRHHHHHQPKVRVRVLLLNGFCLVAYLKMNVFNGERGKGRQALRRETVARSVWDVWNVYLRND